MKKFTKATVEFVKIDANDIYTSESCLVYDPNETEQTCFGREPRT